MLTFPTAQFDGVFMIKLIFRLNVHEKRKFRMKKHGFSNCCCSGCCHHRCINAMRLYVRHFNPMIKYMYGILLNETGTQVLLALHFPCWYDQLENTVFFSSHSSALSTNTNSSDNFSVPKNTKQKTNASERRRKKRY